jgi:hypothetical protein
VTSLPGYPDVITVRQPVAATDGPLRVRLAYQGAGPDAVSLDGVLLVPLVEVQPVGDATGSQALLRSFASHAVRHRVNLPATDLVAQSYDTGGRLITTASSPGHAINAPVQPGGFTLVSSRSLLH